MNQPQTILEYLQKNMPGYPFDPKLDGPFVEELISDFDHINILEETEAFRWFHDNQPPRDTGTYGSPSVDGSTTHGPETAAASTQPNQIPDCSAGGAVRDSHASRFI